ncbi:MAG: DUF937 domain-containing protein [Pseudomonadota bacterium]
MSLLDQLSDVVVGQMTSQAAQKTGLSDSVTKQMLPMAMAVLMNGLKKNTSTPQGAEALSNALERHDGSLLNDVNRIGADDVLIDGQKILGHIFGNKQSGMESALANAAGANQDQVSKLLAMAAPAVLASLGRAKKEQGLDVSDLAGLIAKEGVEAEQKAPNELSGLLRFIDQDGDGSVQDEVLGLGAKLLGGLFGRK